jgi:hypothetical protein
MSKTTEVRCRRRGGGWVDHRPGPLLAELRQLRTPLRAAGMWADPVHRTRRFHPETIATAPAHQREWSGRHPAGETCPAKPDLEDLAALGAGQARMVAGHRAAGVPLDALDVDALPKAIGR